MLAHHALSCLWQESDFQPRDPDAPDLWGCCAVCCAPCAALLYLDRQGILDVVLGEFEYGCESDTHVDGKVDRVWMYQQWSNPVMLAQCGHEAPTP